MASIWMENQTPATSIPVSHRYYCVDWWGFYVVFFKLSFLGFVAIHTYFGDVWGLLCNKWWFMSSVMF